MNLTTFARRTLVAMTAALTLASVSAGCVDSSSPTGGDGSGGGSMRDPSRAAQEAVWGDWFSLWNGDFTNVDQFISADFHLHAALLDGSSDTVIHGVAGITQWVEQGRAAFPDMKFTTQVGPLVDGDHIVGRWVATGTYQGGFPGAKAPPGTVVTFAGTDILRVEDGKIAEYWVNSDTALLLTQLQVQ